jgi:serine/threonine protein kinase/tetratricopeptide (TPR) repeat protein
MTDSSSGERRVVVAFQECFWGDEMSGARRPLSHYLQLFAGHDEAIAAEYLLLTSEASVGAVTEAPFTAPDARGGEARLGPYLIEEEIGRGGQGCVYRARDTRLGRTVALKALSGLGPGAEDRLLRFRREGEVASRLDHPGICGVHDTGIADGVPYIAMRFVRGETLAARIARTRHAAANGGAEAKSEEDDLPTVVDAETVRQDQGSATSARAERPSSTMTRAELDEQLRIVEEAARALHVAHEASIVHRDVKPANIMIDDEGRVVVLDFGLARDDSEEAGPGLTQTGDFFGTPAYMSPEQIAGQQLRLDRRADIYSLGVTLYECLTLQRPHEATTREALYRAVMEEEPRDPRRLNPSLSQDLRVVMETALAKERDRRYVTAEAFADDLRAVREHRPVSARPLSLIGRSARWARRRPTRAALALTLVIGLPVLAALGGHIWASLPEIAAQERAIEAARVGELVEEGFFELRNGDNTKAVELFEEAVGIDAASAEAGAGLALALSERGDGVGALAALDRVEAQLDDPLILRGLRAEILADMGRVKESAAAAAEMPPPEGALAMFIEGLRQFKIGQRSAGRRVSALAFTRTPESKAAFEAAARAFESAVVSSSRAERARHFELAAAVSRLDDAELKTRVADAILALWPDEPEAWRRAAMALRRGDDERSLALFERYLDRFPDDRLSIDGLSWTLSRLGRKEEALSAAIRETERHPQIADAWLMRGTFEADLERWEEARSSHARALELTSDGSGTAHYNLAVVAHAMDDIEAARGHLEAALELDERDAAALSLRGLINAEAGRNEEARADLERAISYQPLHFLPRQRLVAFLQRRGAVEEQNRAIRDMGEALPWHPGAQAALGAMYYNMSQFEKAAAAFERSIEIDPEDIQAHLLLAVQRLRLGEIAAAEAAVARAEAIDPERGEVQVARARIEFTKGDATAGRKRLRALFARQPGEPVSETVCSGFLASVGFALEAEGQARWEIATLPASRDGYYALALALELKGEGELAIANARRAVELTGGGATEARVLQRLLKANRSDEDYLNEMRAAAKRTPAGYYLHLHVGIDLFRKRRYAEALEPLRRADEAEPASSSASAILGQALNRLKRDDEAREHLISACSRFPNQPFIRETLAKVFTRAEQFKEAQAALIESVRIVRRVRDGAPPPKGYARKQITDFKPDRPLVFITGRGAYVLMTEGKLEEAREFVREAQALLPDEEIFAKFIADLDAQIAARDAESKD